MPAVRLCPACRAGAPSRRTDPLCPACLEAVRESVPCPLWPFDSPLMRRVAAEANAPGVIAVVRAATGLSQSDLAALAGWSRVALTLYERGRREAVFDIRVLLGFADAVAMPREALLLPLVLGDVSESGIDVDRRSFGGLAAGAAMTAMLPAAAVPSHVTASHVKYLQASLDSLWEREVVAGGGALLRPALRQRQLARRMLKESSYTEAVGHDLLIVTGFLADVAGWAAFGTANLPLAAQLYREALDLAASAEDPVLTAWALNSLSNLCCYRASSAAGTGRDDRSAAGEALLLSNRAADEARYEPAPWLHVRIALEHAQAASLTASRAAFGSAIARAQRELDRAPGGIEGPRWLQWFAAGPDLITGEQAWGLANLGDLAAAESLYRELLDRDLPPLVRVFRGAQLAGVQLAQDARRDAVETGTTVLALVEDGATSTRALNDLRPVRAAAAKAGDEEFCARFDAAERALTAA
jgi:transcriptional regulator with XRE-family HTH domain